MLRMLATPLFGVGTGVGTAREDPRPVRLQRLTSAFDALSALSAIDPADGTDRFAAIRGQAQKLRDQGDDSARALVDEVFRADSGEGDDADAGRRLSADELLVLLLVGDGDCREAIVSLLRRLTASRWQTRADRRHALSQASRASASSEATRDAGDTTVPETGEDRVADQATDPDLAQLLRLVAIVRKCSQEKVHAGRLSSTIHARLWQVWDATGVARRWQEEAVSPTPRGRAVNDWLDAVIRLFAHAQQAPSGQGVEDFLSDIEGLQIEADSLASVAPRPDAVVLATPAGAAALHKKYVWILAVQDGSWPNLSPRDALFDGQSLSAVIVRGRLRKARALPSGTTAGGSPAAERESPDDVFSGGLSADGDEPTLLAAQDRDQRLDLLYTESKSLLVALTRGDVQTVVSVVDNEQETPSDFLFAYLPELFTRNGLAVSPDVRDCLTYVSDGIRYSKVGRDPAGTDARLPWLGGLDADPEGMAVAARLALAGAISREMAVDGRPRGAMTGETIHDAVRALHLLADAGVVAADPSFWAFVASAQKSEQELDHRESGDMRQGRSEEGDDGFDVTVVRNAGLLRQRGPAPSIPSGAYAPPASSGTTPPSVSPDVQGAVPLSPSAVDSIWKCPLCWSLDHRFAGPQPTDADRSLGAVIHEVAQWATDEGIDRDPALSREGVLTVLRSQYDRLAAQAPQFSDLDQSFRMASGNAAADSMLTHMAAYFVDSRDPGYGGCSTKDTKRTKNAELASVDGVGSLSGVSAEVPVNAQFGVHDIGDYVRRTPGLEEVGDRELFVVLSWLAGGFPRGHARGSAAAPERAHRPHPEHRRDVWDIIDWKTGKTSFAPSRTCSLSATSSASPSRANPATGR